MTSDTIKLAARMVQDKLPNQPRTKRESTRHHFLLVLISKALPLTVSGIARSGALAELRQEAS